LTLVGSLLSCTSGVSTCGITNGAPSNGRGGHPRSHPAEAPRWPTAAWQRSESVRASRELAEVRGLRGNYAEGSAHDGGLPADDKHEGRSLPWRLLHALERRAARAGIVASTALTPLSSTLPTPPAASRARASAPTQCPSRSWASAPSQSRRRSPASRARRIESTGGQSPGGASPRRRGRCRTRSRARFGAERVEGAVVERVREPSEPECCPQELAALIGTRGHSITRSARSSSVCGIVRPSALAVFMLMISSNLVGCSIGRSPALAPFRILST